MTHRHNTTLDTHTVSTLRAYGGGNLSQGIRRAAELVRQWEEANTHLNSTPVPEWQPIETAPRDGSKAWLRVPADEGVISVLGAMRGNDWCGAFWTGHNWASSTVYPTHWMPLPAAPKPRADND